MARIAVVATHPIQYQAPWFRRMAASGIELRVFYLWHPSSSGAFDPGFGRRVEWDIDLGSGYPHEFVPNVSPKRGSSRSLGIVNPALPSRLRSFGADAVVCMGYAYATFLGLAAMPRALRPPLVLRGDSHRLDRRDGIVKESLIRAIFSRFDAFLHVGAANRRYFESFGARDDQLFFSPHAVDPDLFAAVSAEERTSFRARHQIPAEHTVVLFAGKLDENKRVRALVEAFLALDRRNATLLVVGTGNLEAELRALAASRTAVRFAGFVNQSEMRLAYGASDLIVLPSERETWGLCIDEAMHLGVPAIVSDSVGCAEDLIVRGETGWTFPSAEPASLRGVLGSALADSARLARMGTNAARHVEARSYDAATRGLLAAVEHVVDPAARSVAHRSPPA